ncbi:MAG: biotin transporter BioY [Deltaproteobacteria bacterium]|jgi:biotin transport system substrate-specific component|nr:biotin transporter BioY [Deltaproteobacteria bacterium]
MGQAASLARKDIELAVRCAIWAALMAVGAYIAIPIGPVPITLQTFFIILCGFMEGPWAFFPALAYLVAGLIGLPVFAEGAAGPGILFGPTVGYALAFAPAAFVAGLAAKGGAKRIGGFLAFGALATLLIHGCGIAGIHLTLKLSWALSLYADLPFLPGDAAKLLAAAFLAVSAARLRPAREGPSGGGGQAPGADG